MRMAPDRAAEEIMRREFRIGVGKCTHREYHHYLLKEQEFMSAIRNQFAFGRTAQVAAVAIIVLAGLFTVSPGYALDLVGFTGITGPLTSALAQLSSLGPSIKAMVGFIGFVIALIALAAMRNFGPVLFYIGLAIFGAVGLVIAGSIMGAVI
jgi:hypothetical protein